MRPNCYVGRFVDTIASRMGTSGDSHAVMNRRHCSGPRTCTTRGRQHVESARYSSTLVCRLDHGGEYLS